MKILVVDDKSDTLGVMVAILERHGHETDSARNGEEAIAAFSIAVYDLVITDLEMPGMDGHQLIEEIIKTMQYDQRFLLVSGNPDALQKLQPALPPCVTTLVKPFGASALLTAVNAAISKE